MADGAGGLTDDRHGERGELGWRHGEHRVINTLADVPWFVPMMWGTVLALAAPPVISAAMVVGDASTGVGFDPLSLIGTVVTPVIVVGLFLAGKLHPHSEIVGKDEQIAQLRADLQAERTTNAAMQTSIIERAIPALTRTTLVLENLSPLVQTDMHLRRGGEGAT